MTWLAGTRQLFSGSLRRKLVFAFLLAGVLPTLAASYLATRLVSMVFERNVHDWLGDTAAFFINSVQEAESEAGTVAQFMSQYAGLVDKVTDDNGQVVLDPGVRELITGLGYDLVMLYDDDGRVVYTSQPVTLSESLPPEVGATLLQVARNGEAMVMAAAIRSITVAGHPHHLLLGVWIDENFIGGIKELTSLDLRLYSRAGASFPMSYSSQKGGSRSPLAPAISAALLSGAADIFDPAADDGRYSGIYRPLRDADQRVVGVLFCGLRVRETLAGMMSRRNLFLSIVLTASLLSIATGVLIARRLTQPLRSLTEGVTAVTDGDYDKRVDVEGQDEVAGLAVCFNAMSRRLAQLQELEAQYRRRERLSAVGEAATAIAHEVRNPLGIIKTSTELVRKRATLAAREAGLLDHVVDEVRRIDGLIREFLEFASPKPPNLRHLAVAAVAQRVAEGCAPELQRRKVMLAIHDTAPGVEIAGDDDHLYQACLNLVLNACDAMPDGGRLDIDIALNDLTDEVTITFADSGHGVPPELQERIFNPFFTTRARGTGLGLPKVFTVMESHGGRVECGSSPTGGASFTLVFPRPGPNPPATPSTVGRPT